MATNFPAGLDALVNPTPTSNRSTLSHAGQHDNANDAIEALQVKVGVDASADPASLDYKVTANTAAIAANTAGVLTTAQGRIIVTPSATSGTAINAAQAALPANGGTIVLAAGDHDLDVPFLINKEIILEGLGSTTTRVRFNPALMGGGAIRMADTTQRRVVIRNMRIETTTAANGTGTAIDASKFVTATLDNLRIGSSIASPNKAISFPVVGSYYNHVRDCVLSVAGTGGIGIEFLNNANSNTITNVKINSFGGTTGTGVLVGGGAHTILMMHLDVENNDVIAVDVAAPSHDVTLVGCYFELDTIGLRMAAGTESVRVYGGYMSNASITEIQDNGSVGFTVDNLWLNFNPYSYRDERNVTRYRVNGINTPANDYQPDDHALKGWSFDPAAMISQTAATNGSLYLCQINLRYPETITNLLFQVQAAAVTPVASQNYLGLYNSTGTLVASTAATVLDTPTTSVGVKTVALSAPYVAAAGKYWVAILLNAATPAVLFRGGTALAASPGLAAAALRWAVNGTALTALPASITPGSNAIASGLTFWVAAS